MTQGHRLNNLAAEIVAGHFAITCGEPRDLGGDDEGPTPHQVLEAALAACTIITLQMYANRKNMKLVSANVSVKIESETPEATAISRRIELVGELSAQERSRLLEIANKCPIHRILSSRVSIQTQLVENQGLS